MELLWIFLGFILLAVAAGFFLKFLHFLWWLGESVFAGLGKIPQLFKRRKEEKIPQAFWYDYGESIEILGKTFTRKYNGYVRNGLMFGDHSTYGNFFGIEPGIEITKEEFFDRLEKDHSEVFNGN